ncbi:MAG: response regulator transcription factor [Bacteroidota bacterium]|nr:response regulator transcription factor [Bacteroidota bacterium]
MEKIKVLIVDDHALVRDGLCAMFSNLSEITVVGEASSGNEALNKTEAYNPDIILMDIMMPGMNGIEATQIIKEDHPDVKVIFLSMEVTEAFISEAVQVGASGYLPKDSRKNVLIEAITKVAAGGRYFSSSISELVFEKFYENSLKGKKTNISSGIKISKREVEVLKLIASGMSNKDIAEKLFISGRTVDAHRNHIMQKLDIHSTADLVKYAIKNELITI